MNGPRSATGTGVPEAHTYIMCTATDENGSGNVGWFVPVLLWPFRKTWTAEDFHRAAVNQMTLHKTRGGVWEIFSGTTHGEMLIRSCQLRGIKSLQPDKL